MTITIAYTANSIQANGQTYPATYAQDSNTGAIILRIAIDGKTATVTLHQNHADYPAALAAMEAQDGEDIPTFEQAKADWEASHADELQAKRAKRAAFLAQKQARKEAKPLPEWAGQSLAVNGVTLRYDAFHRDTMIVFSSVPLPPVREAVKAAGFYWAPSKGAWVRGLNAKSKRAAERLMETLSAMPIYPARGRAAR